MKTKILLLALILLPFSMLFGQKMTFDAIMKMGDDSLKIDSLSKFGTDIQFDKMTESLRCQQEALKIAEKIGDKKRVGIALSKIGSEEILLEKYPEALDHLQQAYKIFEEQKNYKRLVRTMQKMAQVFDYEKDDASAMSYYKKTLELAKKYKNEEYEAHALHSIASKQKELGEYKNAIQNFKIAIAIYEKLGLKDDLQGSLYNLAGVYSKQKQFDKSIELLENFTKYHQKKQNLYEEAMGFGKMAEVFLEKKDYVSAEQNSKESIQIFEKQGAVLNEKVESYNMLRKIYEAQNNIPAAFEALKKWQILNDTLSNQNNRKTVATLQTKFETVQKETQIKDLDKANETQRNQLIWAIIGLSVLAGLLGLSIFLYRKLQSKNHKIEEQSSQLSRLMKELHHRVKNNLAIVSSLLMMQSSRLKDESAIKAVKEGQMRVDAMSLIHQRLYLTENVSSLNIKTYLTELAESLMKAYGYSADNFDLQVNVENPELDVDLAIPIGLIVNELVTNSMKYAYEGIKKPSLTINFKNTKNITLQVQDNGIGFDEKLMDKKINSFGKKLIAGLSKQVKGEFKFENQDGTHFELVILKMAA